MSEQMAEFPTFSEIDAQHTHGVRYWQQALDKLPYHAVTDDMRAEAVEALNDTWKFSGDDCAFSGIALFQPQQGKGEIVKDIVECGVGKSLGMAVVSCGPQDAPTWRVSYAFEQASDSRSTIAANRVAYLIERSLTHIVPFCSVEEAFDGMQQPHFALSQLSDVLVEELNCESFLQLSASDQYQHVNYFFHAANETAQEWGGIKDKLVSLEAERGYVLNITDTGARYERVDLHELSVRGTCQGVDVLARHHLLRQEPLRSAAQLIDERAGLFLEVMPDAATAIQLGMLPTRSQALFLPISGQELAATFFEAAETP